MRKTAILAASAMLIGSLTFAGTQNDAGCGVGSLIFKNNEMGAQILAATTNGTFGNQTFGITTGTLGCTAAGNLSQSTRADVERAQKNFVAANYRDLSREMAQGQGEYLNSLADLLGCSPSAAPSFGKMTQKNYGQIFPSKNTTPDDVLGALKLDAKKDAALARSCTLI
ncbi:MAG TPA: DUF3015 domain-containing protein [Elusimicrobiota bacterium]|nr:DUF3015 domain-containing protein [Elusimicrobiota bacterium]